MTKLSTNTSPTYNKNAHTITPIIVCVLIALCFLYTGAGYLSWMYHLIDFYSTSNVDVLTEVIGYLFQVLGILIFSIVTKKAMKSSPISSIVILSIDLALIIAACLSPNAVLTLILGYLMNIAHGLVAGVYLTLLVTHVTQQKRALVFAIGYAVGTVLSHLISTIGSDNFLRDNRVLIIYAIITVLSIITVYLCCSQPQNTELLKASDQNASKDATETADAQSQSPKALLDSPVLLTLFTVFLLCSVKNMGFSSR